MKKKCLHHVQSNHLQELEDKFNLCSCNKYIHGTALNLITSFIDTKNIRCLKRSGYLFLYFSSIVTVFLCYYI